MSSTVTGTMKGTISNFYTGVQRPFTSTNVFRHNSNHHLNVTGYAGGFAGEGIAFRLADENALSGTYEVGSDSVVGLFYFVNPSGEVFEAVSGTIHLQNHQPEERVNGRLNFRYHTQAGEQVDVEAVFAIEGIDRVP
ncbi:hypothetical protein [Pseudomonas frederiksbergensis]|uniref:DUF3224 domain-containing protein n=1 Tax=Pseudomonas frederiksbergensis TaxID=104087 RepID=A0A423KGJ3_9PSED|nr:hypothetical protein [Pseudomonas frederiksbergensis]RON51931.1 hypothetical protein BK665_18915 [Pseudomonas frederiksbergensis]